MTDMVYLWWNGCVVGIVVGMAVMATIVKSKNNRKSKT
jgi:hypothetical protein